MKLLADESVDQLIIYRLRSDGHDVESVTETTPSISDEVVLQRASQAGIVLLTADKDFGELVFRQQRAHAGVILLRLAGLPSLDRSEIVSEVVQTHEADFPGNFTVISPDHVRVNRLSDLNPGST